MKKETGLWIDHRKAVIVTITDGNEEIKKIKSNVRKQTRFAAEGGLGEDIRDRQFDNELNKYYDEVVEYLRDAETIQIFGPGEAKGELEKRLDHHGVKAKISTEAADKMTDNQISAKVRELFLV